MKSELLARQRHESIIWTIYDRPKDCPDHVVLRRWYVTAGSTRPGPCELFDTIQEARLRLPRGLFNMRRQDGDDPKIAESWI
jgi:hypothetical protein